MRLAMLSYDGQKVENPAAVDIFKNGIEINIDLIILTHFLYKTLIISISH
jgi:hypothetical protein